MPGSCDCSALRWRESAEYMVGNTVVVHGVACYTREKALSLDWTGSANNFGCVTRFALSRIRLPRVVVRGHELTTRCFGSPVGPGPVASASGPCFVTWIFQLMLTFRMLFDFAESRRFSSTTPTG